MKIEFVAGRFGLRSRFIIAIFLYALAALIHALCTKGGLPFPLVISAPVLTGLSCLFLNVKTFTNKPTAAGGRTVKSSSAQTEIWKPVDMTDLARLEDRIGNARKIKIPFVYDVSFGIVCTFVSFFLLFPISFNFGKYGLFTLINLYFIFFPFFWFAKVVKWYPKKLARKLNAFGPLLAAELPENIHFVPMLCFDGERAEVTKDIRLMLAPGANTPESVRDELSGVQFQVTYNRGPNGEVPYMYAVFITKGTEKLWEYLKAVRCPGYVIEAGSSREDDEVYGTVVLRQDTQSRADGFYTHERDIEELLHLVIEILKKAGGGS